MAGSEKGHTLIELMVVLSLIGILAGLAFANPNSNASHYNLRYAAQQLASDLRLIRQKAISEGGSNKVQFIYDSRQYHLPGMGERSLPAHIRFGTPSGVPHLPDAGSMPPDGVSFNQNRITFQPNGTIQGVGGAVYLTNDSNRRETAAITVNVTGRVKIYRWNGLEWK